MTTDYTADLQSRTSSCTPYLHMLQLLLTAPHVFRPGPRLITRTSTIRTLTTLSSLTGLACSPLQVVLQGTRSISSNHQPSFRGLINSTNLHQLLLLLAVPLRRCIGPCTSTGLCTALTTLVADVECATLLSVASTWRSGNTSTIRHPAATLTGAMTASEVPSDAANENSLGKAVIHSSRPPVWVDTQGHSMTISGSRRDTDQL